MPNPLDPRATEGQDPRLAAPARVGELDRRIANLERASGAAPTCTVATRPAYTDVRPGTIIYVSDGASGAHFQGATASGWVNLG